MHQQSGVSLREDKCRRVDVYRGTKNSTMKDDVCMEWDTTLYFEAALEGDPPAHNWCRNPDKDSRGPWCYTEEGVKEYCFNLCEEDTNTAAGNDAEDRKSEKTAGWYSWYMCKHNYS